MPMIRFVFALLLLLTAAAAPALAGDVLFSIRLRDKPDFRFDVTEPVIATLSQTKYKTRLPGGDEQLHEMRGPLIRDLLKLAGVTGETAYAVALDKYEVEIPVSDFDKYDVIAAVEMDGKVLNVRSKGPAWVVYPVSGTPELEGDPVIEARMIWQLKEIDLK